MSSVDERVVKMTFDNSQFASKISDTVKSLTQLNQTTEDIASNTGGLAAVGRAFEQCEALSTKAGFHIQDVWTKMANILETQVANKIVDMGKKIANALTLEGVSDGFREYELKMGSIQTIMAGTGESLATVNRHLDELNKYSDQTIYSFADMTNNIGKFTNAGVKLEDAVAAIKGIANEAAISGANANEASRAMYNFSQALSAGYVKLIDWKSIENANMATKGFKETLLDVASAVGTVEKAEDGMYKILTTNAQGKTMDDLVSGTKNFNDSLQQQWMTTEVLTKALKIYATNIDDLSETEKAAYRAELEAMNLSPEQIENFENLGRKATAAASEIKTFTMMMDTLKEAIGSGWAMTWQLVIGDFEQAKALWTEVGGTLSSAIDQMSDARNNLIKESMTTGWEKFTNIAGAAIPESEKYRDVLLEVAKSHKLLTEEQIKDIDSTEKLVASFHDLKWVSGDVLVESVNKYADSISRMSAEERKEAGISEASLTELKALNDQLRSGAIDADAYAASMVKLGGRENVIEGLRNSFRALMAIVKPIGEAMREVFPPITAKQLYNLTEGFKEFTKNLIASEKTIDKIKRTAKGFFSIFDIGAKFIKALVGAILPATKGLSGFATSFLDTTASVGDFITNLDETITKGKVFEKLFSSIGSSVSPIFNAIKTGVSVALTALRDFFTKFNDVSGPIAFITEKFTQFFTFIANGINFVIGKVREFTPSFEDISKIASTVGGAIKKALNTISESLTGFSFGTGGLSVLINLFQQVLTGGLILKLYKGLDALDDIFDSLGETMEGFQKEVSADVIMKIAKAIAIMAGSLVLVSLVDSKKLGMAVAAIGAMAGVLTAAMAGLMKAIDMFSTTDTSRSFSIFGKKIFGSDATRLAKMAVTLRAVSKALIAMGAAVLMMSVGLKIVADAAESGHLWDSFAVITLMLAELTGVAILLGKFGGKATKGAKNLQGMTVALILMAEALKIVSDVVNGGGNYMDALGIITAMLLELTVVSLLLGNFGGSGVKGALSLISFAVSINLLVIALKSISDELGKDGNHMVQAMVVISILLAEMTAVTILMSKFGALAVLGGAGALLGVASILLMVQALKQVSDMLGQTDQHVWQALGVIAASLVVLALGLTLMVAALPGAAALVVASAGLIVLGAALKILGSLKVGEIAKSLITLFLALSMLVVGLTLMAGALPGAAALVIAAAGLTVLAIALKLLGSISLWGIVKSLLALTVGLVGLAVVGTVLAVLSPLMVVFAGVCVAVGAGMLAAGVGISMFSTGLQTLIAILPMAGRAIKLILVDLIGLIPVIAEAFADTVVMLSKKVVQYAPMILTAISMIINLILTVIASSTVKIAKTVLTIILGILQALNDKMPDIWAAGTELIVNFINGISEGLPMIIDAAYNLAITLINSLATAIETNNVELIEAVDHLMTAIIQAITQWLVQFTPLGALIPQDVKDGIMSGELKVKEAIDNILKKAIDGIKKKVGDFKEAAENLIGGFIEGLKGTTAGKAISAAVEFGSNVVKGLKSKDGLDEHSPSKKSFQAAKDFVSGFVNGTDKYQKNAISSVTKLGGAITDAFQVGETSFKMPSIMQDTLNLVASMADNDMTLKPVISPVLDLSGVRAKAGAINGLFPAQSISLASAIGIGKYKPEGSASESSSSSGVVGQQINYVQNNYSPKALSTIEIYRHTKNQIGMLKGVNTNA